MLILPQENGNSKNEPKGSAGKIGGAAVILTSPFFGNTFNALYKKSQKIRQKIVAAVKRRGRKDKVRRQILEKPEKLKKNVGNFMNMEDAPGKKALDFFGRIVHNEVYPVRLGK